MSDQEHLIGRHPDNNCFLGNWLLYEDLPPKENKKHRKLIESSYSRRVACEEVGKWLLKHHISESKLKRLERKRKILEKHDLQVHLKANYPFPSNESTKKGNCAEIILSEYLQQASGLHPLVYRLRYNGNVDQAMKGDDCLLFDVEQLSDKVIVAEAKFRLPPSKRAVLEIVKNLEGQKRLPVSIPFVANCLEEAGKEDLADQLEDLLTEIHKGKTAVINVGFLLGSASETSSKDTFSTVERHLECSNKNLVFVSLGVESPNGLINESFDYANELYYDTPTDILEEAIKI